MRIPLSRAVAFSIVVLLHIAVLGVGWQRPIPERREQQSLTLVYVEPRTKEPPREPEPVAPVREQDTAIHAPRTAAPVPAPAAPGPPVDWRASMEAAASAAVAEIIRQEGYRPLGPEARRDPGSSAPKSIFEPPRRKPGDIEGDAVQGRTLIWHSEHCYTELRFPTIKDPNAIVGAPNAPKCMFPIGKKRPRGDLFDELKERQ